MDGYLKAGKVKLYLEENEVKYFMKLTCKNCRFSDKSKVNFITL